MLKLEKTDLAYWYVFALYRERINSLRVLSLSVHQIYYMLYSNRGVLVYVCENLRYQFVIINRPITIYLQKLLTWYMIYFCPYTDLQRVWYILYKAVNLPTLKSEIKYSIKNI
jgi:hypothetical protein